MSYNPQNPNGQATSANSAPVVVASDQSAVPVSDADLGQSQGTATSGQKGPLVQGAVTTSPPSYTTAQTSPISLDTSGNLRTSVNNTVTVSGTVTTSPPSNASVNLNQVAGGAVTNAGQTGALQVGGAVATNSNVSSATNPVLIAGSDYGGTPKVQTMKVDSSGNAQMAITNTPTVTANAGTNLNTSALATSTNVTGGGQKTQLVDGSGNVIASTSNALNVAITSGGSDGTSSNFGSAFPAPGTAVGATDGTNMQPLKVDGSDNLLTKVNAALPAGTNVIGHVIADSGSTTAVTQATASNLNATVVGAGSAGTANAGVMTVQGIASMTKLLVTPDANSSINVSQVGGSSTAIAASGTQKVGIVGNAGAAFDAATNAAPPANALQVGGVAATALPSAFTATDLAPVMLDKFGRQVVLANAQRDLVLPMTQLTLTASTSETTLISQVASTFLDIVSLIVINTSGTATQVDFRDSTGGTIRLSLYIPAGDMRGIALPTPMPQNAVNNNWTAKCGTSVSSIIITGSYITNK